MFIVCEAIESVLLFDSDLILSNSRGRSTHSKEEKMFWDSNADSKTLGALKIATWCLYLDFTIFSCEFSTAAEDSPPHPIQTLEKDKCLKYKLCICHSDQGGNSTCSQPCSVKSY